MRVAALNFHGIGTPRRTLEPGEADYWIPRAFFARILDRLAAPAPGDAPAAISFDDGNASDLSIAAPMLAERGLTGAFFVLSGRLGLPGALDEGDVRALAAAGMEIGSHGVDHRDWRRLSDAELDREIEDCRARLAQILGRRPEAVAIPFGGYDRRVMRRLLAAGYARIWTSDGGLADDRRRIRPRLSVRRDMTMEDIDAALAGREPLKRRLRRFAAMTAKGGRLA